MEEKEGKRIEGGRKRRGWVERLKDETRNNITISVMQGILLLAKPI